MPSKSELGFPQHLKDACRWVTFQTEYEGFEVATNGGTLFLVAYKGEAFGITARHNLHSFDWKDMLVGKARTGAEVAHVVGFAFAGSGTGKAEDSALTDVGIMIFSKENLPAFFDGGIYDFDSDPACLSNPDDDLVIYGAISRDSFINETSMSATFGELGFVDVAPNTHDTRHDG